MMRLWQFASLIVFMCGTGTVDGEIDYSDDPESEALNSVFGPDDAKHTGPERLKWHMEHLKWTSKLLHVMNWVKKNHDNRTFINKMQTIEDKWTMLYMMRELNQMGEDTGLKYDIFEGDSYVLHEMAWAINRTDFTQWVAKHFQNQGPDFLKYIVQKEDFGYIMKDPEKFVAAFYELGTDPVALAVEIGMTLPQLRMLGEALEKAMLPRPEYWDQPILLWKINMEMHKLGLLAKCPWHLPSVFDETK